ncbi:hypothetical protein AURDEDRAFT_188606 [Auricularia subglabra TFB-10046 SS5]|nr:hypothetical protein AURDEDRAFT_188606 [Auricularia subglabra TFB-10046 SS5]
MSTEHGAAVDFASLHEAEYHAAMQRIVALLQEHCSAGSVPPQYDALLARLAADLHERDCERDRQRDPRRDRERDLERDLARDPERDRERDLERDRDFDETAAELRRLTEVERAHAATIKQQELVIDARGQTISGLCVEVRQLEKRIQQRDARIEALVAEIERMRYTEHARPQCEQLGATSAPGREMDCDSGETINQSNHLRVFD